MSKPGRNTAGPASKGVHVELRHRLGRARIFYKDRGDGRPVVLSHGWPLNSDSWEAQGLFLAANGYRVIAHDRRGHGRSTQTWGGNEMDTYADDLAALIDFPHLG